MKRDHLCIGREGEKTACRYLEANGYQILCCNVEIGKNEIDIVAEKGDMIVFVEVKSRKDGDDFAPSDRVDWRKIRILQAMATIWIDRRSDTLGRDISARIDVIGVSGGKVVEHYEDIIG